MSDGPPGVIEPTSPLPQQYPIDYTTISPVNGDNVITASQSTVTISGEIDEAAGVSVVTFLEPYGLSTLAGGAGNGVAAVSDLGTVSDLNQNDGLGNELGAWSTTISTAGLAPGIYVAQSYVAFSTGNGSGPVYEDGGLFGKEIVTVAPTDEQTTGFSSDATSAMLSTDGRYLVYTNGQTFEHDLQTGATTVIPDGSSPTGTFATDYLPDGVADNGTFLYQTFQSANGAYTFGTIVDYDQNTNNGRNNPIPVVTDNATGDQSVLGQFGAQRYNIGAAVAASNNGNVVLSEQTLAAQFSFNNINGYAPDPSIDVSYLTPAPTLTLDTLNGNNRFGIYAGAPDVTLSGTSNAIGQQVEIDFGEAGNAVGTAEVVDDGKGDGNGTWSFAFNPAQQNITADSLFVEASVSSAEGTPSQVTQTLFTNSTAPLVLGASASSASGNTRIAAGDTITIDVQTNTDPAATGTPTLTLSNGAVATYSRSLAFGGFPFPTTYYAEFTYTPSLKDASGPLSITGLNLPSGAFLGDFGGDAFTGPFDQSLGLTLQTAPTLNGGGFYSSALPIISGTGDSGDTITLMEDGKPIGSTMVAATPGTPTLTGFGIAVTQPLSQGQHVLTAVAADGMGGISAVSDPITITIDSVAPTVAISTVGAVTDTRSQTIAGTVDAADGDGIVSLYDGNQFLGSVISADDGSWSATITLPATKGAHAITARASDSAGNVGISAAITFTLDIAAPVLAISTAGGLTNQPIQKITGTIDEADGGSVVSLYDGTQLLGTVKSAADGSWSRLITLPMTQGDHVITAEAGDTGNVGSSAAVTYTLDTAAPVLAISTVGGLTNRTSQTIAGTIDKADAGSFVSVYDGKVLLGTVKPAADGRWSLSAALPSTQGIHTITAQATDAADNTGTSPAITYTLDIAAPVLTISTAGGLTNQLIQKITGTIDKADAGSAISLYDGARLLGTVKAAADSSWSRLVTLPETQGDHDITAKATDAAGNTGSSVAVTYTLDTVAPVVTIATEGELTNQPIQKITGTVDAADGGSLVSLYDGTVLMGTVKSAADGSWSRLITLPETQGNHVITAKATDAADNTGSSAPTSFTLDTVAPTLTITTPGVLTNRRTHTIKGTISLSDAGVEVALYDGATLVGEVVTAANGTWSDSVIFSATQGAHLITAKAPDNADNLGVSAPVTYKLDTIAPTLKITSVKKGVKKRTESIVGLIDSGDAKRVISIYDNNKLVGTAKPSAKGAWTKLIVLRPGKNVIEAVVADAAGNKTTSKPVTIKTTPVAPAALPPASTAEPHIGLFIQAISAFSRGNAGQAVHDHASGSAMQEHMPLAISHH